MSRTIRKFPSIENRKPHLLREIKLSIGTSMKSLGLIAFRVYENEKGYTKALDLKLQSGEVIHIETMGSIAQGLNDAGYLGGEWIDPPKRAWKWFGGKED